MAIRELSDEEYNADGSYSYPPRPRSAAQHIDFWTRVPLPEEKLETLMARYPAVREGLGEIAGTRAAAAYRREHPDPGIRRAPTHIVEAWQAEVGKVFDAAAEKATAHMPAKIFRTSVRPIARAHQMYVYSRPLAEEDRQKVFDLEMHVDGRTMTVKEIYEAYELAILTKELL